jgi:hypothetical protein
MIEQETARGGASSSTRISEELKLVWDGYALAPSTTVRTEIQGDVVTCRLTDAVDSLNSAMGAPGSFRTRSTLDAYRRDAIAAVVGVTRQRVTGLVSTHDPATGVATEVFTLERLRRGTRLKRFFTSPA